jgi:uncharacterized protein YutE (UPF0331/DUF86 family)
LAEPDDGPLVPRSKNVRRLDTILGQLTAAREQLLVAMEDIAPDFDLRALIAAAESPDARERNKIAVIERQYEVLLNWLNELAARTLAEGQRLKVIEKSPGHPWQRLATLGAISHRTAARLQEAMEMRDALAHAYPPAAWRALHDGVRTLLDELDRYTDRLVAWAAAEGILPDG